MNGITDPEWNKNDFMHVMRCGRVSGVPEHGVIQIDEELEAMPMFYETTREICGKIEKVNQNWMKILQLYYKNVWQRTQRRRCIEQISI